MDLREIARLDLQGARELLFACMTDLKRHEKDIAALAAEKDTWTGRVTLAESRGLGDLASGARTKVAEVEGRIAGIADSAAEIRADIARLREALPGIRARERSIDPDRLLAELQLLSGELLGDGAGEGTAGGDGSGGASLEKKFEALETAQPGREDPLAALKRKMGLG